MNGLRRQPSLQSMKYYSEVIKKNENFAICDHMNGPRGYYASETSQTEKDKLLSFICET